MRITIIGSGYVGLVTGACLAKIGHEVRCVDLDSSRIAMICEGTAPFHEPGLNDLLKEVVTRGALRPMTDLDQAMVESDVSIIAVGTPPTDDEGGIDLTYIQKASKQLGECIRHRSEYHVVIVKSTVVPSTTDTLVRRTIEEASGKVAGEFGLCMNPEFLREGSAVDDFMMPDRIVIGQFDERSGDVVAQMYGAFECPVVRTSIRSAEMMKYSSNCLLSVLISFSNELANICERTPDTDIDVVMDGLALDRRLSPMVNGTRVTPGILSYLRPGIGFGGSCLPKDVNALRAFARNNDVKTPMLDAAFAINRNRSDQVLHMLRSATGRRGTVGVLGLAFKAGTDDLRASPSITLVSALLGDGWAVKVYDPLIKAPTIGRLLPASVHVCGTVVEAFDHVEAVILATAWPQFLALDWITLSNGMNKKLIVDGRNVLRTINWPADVDYRPIGVATMRLDSTELTNPRERIRNAGELL
jgi:UDPglucose 6-dehydrogenase